MNRFLFWLVGWFSTNPTFKFSWPCRPVFLAIKANRKLPSKIKLTRQIETSQSRKNWKYLQSNTNVWTLHKTLIYTCLVGSESSPTHLFVLRRADVFHDQLRSRNYFYLFRVCPSQFLLNLAQFVESISYIVFNRVPVTLSPIPGYQGGFPKIVRGFPLYWESLFTKQVIRVRDTCAGKYWMNCDRELTALGSYH